MGFKYSSGLDGLRGYAVLIVILFHCNIIYWGWLGVQLFFTLSGFLITLSLFSSKTSPLKQMLKVFYIKRGLRIFPLYFVFLLFILLLHFFYKPNAIANDWPYLISYTYNIYRSSESYIYSNLYSHLWSLSVEEQFYLVWPFLIFFLASKNYIKVMVGVLVAFALLKLFYSALVEMNFFDQEWVVRNLYFQTFYQADAFVFGALAACLYTKKVVINTKLCIWMISAISVFALLLEYFNTGSPFSALRLMSAPAMFDGRFLYGFGYTVAGLFAMLCILYTVTQSHSNLRRILLENRFIVYTGKISYGLYIFHYPIIHLLEDALQPAGSASLMLIYILCIFLSYLIAGLSYKYFESPLLALKAKY
ncbi:MAG: acyltransferase family protein [Oleiphilus sp.]